MVNSKTKGACAELEILKWFSKELGVKDLSRNFAQAKEGGADCLGIDGFALEVKRQEKLNVAAWWVQTVDQATRTHRMPLLAYRQNRKPWCFCLPASLITPDSWGYLTLTSDEFVRWFKSRDK